MSFGNNHTRNGTNTQEIPPNIGFLPSEEKNEIESDFHTPNAWSVISNTDFGTPEEQFAKWLDLTNILHYGGHAAYIWQCSEARKGRTLKGGNVSYTEAAFKQTIWYTTNTAPHIPAQKANDMWLNSYFGVHPTNRIGQRYQRATNAPNEKSPHVYACNCLFAEFDAKDFDSELAAIAKKYKDHLKEGNSPETFDASGAMAARQRGMQIAWNQVLRMPLSPSFIVMSGGGFQTYTLFNETILLDSEKMRQWASNLQAAWVSVVGGDSGAKDLARVLRIPGTYNFKGYYEDGPHLAHFIPTNETRYDIAAIEKEIKSAQRSIFTASSSPSNHFPQSTNSQSSKRPPIKPELSPQKIATTKKTLSQLSKERCDNYESWIKVGIVLHHELADAGLPLWIEWSKQSSKYEEGACEAKWSTFATGSTKIGLGSLIRWAKEDNAEPLSAFEDIKFKIDVLMANGATTEEITIKIDEWTEQATALLPVELSSICKVLRFTCNVKAQDIAQWRRDINATKKARQKIRTPADKLVSKIADYQNDVDLVGFERNDAGNADAVCAKWNHTFRHVEQWGWLYWTGTHWETQGAEKVLFATVKVVLRERITQALNANLDPDALKSFYHACTPSTNRIKNTVIQLKMHPEWDRTPDQWDAYDHLLNVANGVIDLRTTELTEHNPDLMFTSCIQTAFNPYADVTLITSYLLDLGLSWKVIDYLQMAAGYTLTGYTIEECLFYLFGPTRSGKGTFCSALIELLGRPLAAEIDFNTLTGSQIQNADAQNFALAPLKPCRLVVSSESSKYQALNEEKVKRITGGDQIHCAFKGKTHFNYRPKFKIWLASNHKPKADVDDDAIWGSRIKIITFPKSFLGNENKGLKKQLTQNPAYQEALLLWAVQGAYKWYNSETGLVVPQEVKDATAKARHELDYVQQWIDENLTVLDKAKVHITSTTATAKGWTANHELYTDYENWCNENGVNPKKARGFGQSLTKKGYERKRLRKENSKKRIYVRFGLAIEKKMWDH